MSQQNLTCSLATQVPSTTIRYGNLNDKEPMFYFQMSDISQLLAIIQTAPNSERTVLPTSPTQQQLLAEIFRLREVEIMGGATPTNAVAELEKLLATCHEDLIKLSEDNPTVLKSMMDGALVADNALLPRSVPNSRHLLAAIAINWQLEALKQSSAPIFAANANPPLPPTDATPNINLSTILRQSRTGSAPSTIPRTRRRPDLSSDEQHDANDRLPKRNKPIIQPNTFSFGAKSFQPDTLQHYPGKEHSATSLAVDELLGTAILSTLIKRGTDIMAFLANSFKHWRKNPNGLSSHSEMDAFTLGRMIHLELLTHRSPKEALQQRPSLEVALRRLYAILYAEETLNQGDHQHRRDAWNDIKEILEITAQGTIASEEIAESVTKRLKLNRKRLSRLKNYSRKQHEVTEQCLFFSIIYSRCNQAQQCTRS